MLRPLPVSLLLGATLLVAACGDDSATGGGGAGAGGGDGGTGAVANGGGPNGGAGGAEAGGGEGGSGGDLGPAPEFRNPVDTADGPLALQALQILGANVDNAGDGCVPCHSLTESKLTEWGGLTNGVLDECLVDLDVTTQESAVQMLECVRARSGMPNSKFFTESVGFWASGAQRDWWEYTFRKAYPSDGEQRYADFVAQVKMPPGNDKAPLTDEEYDIVGEWFVRGMPLLDELVDDDPPVGECDDLITGAVGDHVTTMATQGWRAVNTSNTMLMYDCAGASNPRQCLSSEPAADANWAVAGQGVLKELFRQDYASAFWSRGSASGRYVGHGRTGQGQDSAIIDLQTNTVVGVDALYDPAFFPDDSGFMFQGGPRNVCSMSVLTAGPTLISMTEAGCADIDQVGLYQHVGAALGGGDYFGVSGPFVSDNSGHNPTHQNPEANFGGNATAFLTPMVFNGTTYSPKQQNAVPIPYEGDAAISQSARLLITRASAFDGSQSGYILRRIDATPNGNGGYNVATPTIARYCYKGGKPAFSYDERYMVIHHYIEDTDEDAQDLGFADANDPGFAAYRNDGGANVYLVELTTGVRTRITNMGAGQYALFPFFRNDGWIYFVVRTILPDGEWVVASDAALVAEGL